MTLIRVKDDFNLHQETINITIGVYINTKKIQQLIETAEPGKV
jgi:hypothetical protein